MSLLGAATRKRSGKGSRVAEAEPVSGIGFVKTISVVNFADRLDFAIDTLLSKSPWTVPGRLRIGVTLIFSCLGSFLP